MIAQIYVGSLEQFLTKPELKNRTNLILIALEEYTTKPDLTPEESKAMLDFAAAMYPALVLLDEA